MTTFDLRTAMTQLRDLDRDVRARAAIEIGKAADQAALDVLVERLCDERDPFVRENITWAIVRMGPAAVAPLAARLDDPRPLVRHDAAHALGKVADLSAREPLLRALRDSDPTVVAKAVFSLGQLGDATVVPELVGLLGGESRELESALVTVLGAFPEAAEAPLRTALKSGRAAVRQHAADLLRTIGAASAVPALIDLVEDEDEDVRLSAVYAIGELGGPAAVIAPLRNDPDARVRAMAQAMSARG